MGWLDKTSVYCRGLTSAEFKQEVLALVANPTNITRGWHACTLCPKEDPSTTGPIILETEVGEVVLGNAEIHVPGHEELYVAPTLMYHYVNEHDYRPPERFIEAVLLNARRFGKQ